MTSLDLIEAHPSSWNYIFIFNYLLLAELNTEGLLLFDLCEIFCKAREQISRKHLLTTLFIPVHHKQTK